MSSSPHLGSRTGARGLPIFAGILAAHAVLVARFWFITDDAYITFRYARNFCLGHRPHPGRSTHPGRAVRRATRDPARC